MQHNISETIKKITEVKESLTESLEESNEEHSNLQQWEKLWNDNTSSRLSLNTIEETLPTLKNNFIHQDSPFVQSIKMVILSHYGVLCIGALLECLLEDADKIARHLDFWKKRDNSYRILLEKTPWFWLDYLWVKRGEVIGPMREVRLKLDILRDFENLVMYQIGALSYILSLTPLSSSTDLAYFNAELLDESQNFFSAIDQLKEGGQLDTHINHVERNEGVEPTIEELYEKLEDLVLKTRRYRVQVGPIWHFVAKTPYIIRNWLFITLGCLGSLFIFHNIHAYYGDIQNLFLGTKDAVINFYKTQVEGLLEGIYHTIKYDGNRQVQALQQAATKTSEDSLARMVLAYNLEHNSNLDPKHLDEIEIAARYGNLSTIMPEYEKEMVNPLKNAIFGEFIRLILIQVQKLKVDVERMLLHLDKLLQANELNFSILAAVPGIFTLYILYHFITRERTPEVTHQAIRVLLREVHVLLNKNNTLLANLDDEELDLSTGERSVITVAAVRRLPLSCAELGRLVSGVHRLFYYARRLPRLQRSWMEEDLREVESERFSVAQRLTTIHRMYSTYPFLYLNKNA